MLDFDAYLRRINLSEGAAATLTELHLAHATSIPFENLDPHRGIPVSLAQDVLERKLVHDRRGGYCFEHNLLFASALEHLGYKVEPMLARVRFGAPPRTVRPRGHLLLRVTDQQHDVWHVDVGFGLGTLLEPIPFGPGRPHSQSGWSFRVAEEADLLVLQTETAAGWADVYAFQPQPVPRVDIETSNWWTCTNPGSPFVSGLVVTRNKADGSRVAVSDWSGPLQLRKQSPAVLEVTQLEREELPTVLADLGLPGFKLGANGRLA